MVLDKQPKEMIIVGSGAIGVEFAYFYNSMGSKVTLIEYQDRVVPVEDHEISKQLQKSFQKKGIEVITNSEVISVEKKSRGVSAKVVANKKEQEIKADVLLSAVGIKSNIEEIV